MTGADEVVEKVGPKGFSHGWVHAGEPSAPSSHAQPHGRATTKPQAKPQAKAPAGPKHPTKPPKPPKPGKTKVGPYHLPGQHGQRSSVGQQFHDEGGRHLTVQASGTTHGAIAAHNQREEALRRLHEAARAHDAAAEAKYRAEVHAAEARYHRELDRYHAERRAEAAARRQAKKEAAARRKAERAHRKATRQHRAHPTRAHHHALKGATVAATLTADGELTYYSFPIEKAEDTASGDVIVYGKATDGTVDSDFQIVDPDWSAKALQDWLDSGGNVRVQHQARRDPAGKGMTVEITPDGHYVKALIVEPVAKELVRKGVLTAYSVGIAHPDIRPDPTGKAMNGIITGRRDGNTKISELSLVDRGSNFNSRFQLVKALGAELEFVGKMLGDDRDAVKVAAGRYSPADLAKLLAHKAAATQLEKRNFDPNVGGGVDRDELPAGDFAGPDRSFPIHSPGDVSDAASSLGRTKHDPEQVKRNIIRIAHRKGDAYVAQLPDSWKTVDVTDDEDGLVKGRKCPTCKGKGKIRGGHITCRDCHGTGYLGDGDDAAEKGAKVMCKGCGANVSAKHAFCPECGKKMATSDVQKNHSFSCLGCGHKLDKGEGFCPGCGKANPGYNEAKKAVRAALEKAAGSHEPGHHNRYDALTSSVNQRMNAIATLQGKAASDMTDDELADLITAAVLEVRKADGDVSGDAGGADADDDKPADTVDAGGEGADEDADTNEDDNVSEEASQTKAAEPTPGDVPGKDVTPTQPVPAHREPDGEVVAEFERDAKLPTDTTGDTGKTAPSPEVGALLRLKALGVPTDLGKLHDLTCPAYHPDDVAKAWPHADLGAVDEVYWEQKALDAAAGAPLAEAGRATRLWQHVVSLKGASPADLLELRSLAFKAFSDANPGPGTAPSPSELSPQRYKRPYLAAGHAAPSPAHGGPNTAPIIGGHIQAQDYTRGYLDAGHAHCSPGNEVGKADRGVGVPTPPGAPQRTHYPNVGRDNAAQAMAAMHDHLAQTFPDLCPMAPDGSPYRGGQPPAPPAVPAGVGGPIPHQGGVTKTTASVEVDAATDARPTLNVRKLVRRLEKAVLAGELTLREAQARLADLDQTSAPAAAEKAAQVTQPVAQPGQVVTPDLIQDLIQRAVGAATEAQAGQLAELRKTVGEQAQLIDKLAAEPEPGGPYRGMAIFPPPTPARDAPVQKSSAERSRDALTELLLKEWRTNPDPTAREAAWAEISKMTQ